MLLRLSDAGLRADCSFRCGAAAIQWRPLMVGEAKIRDGVREATA